MDNRETKWERSFLIDNKHDRLTSVIIKNFTMLYVATYDINLFLDLIYWIIVISFAFNYKDNLKEEIYGLIAFLILIVSLLLFPIFFSYLYFFGLIISIAIALFVMHKDYFLKKEEVKI